MTTKLTTPQRRALSLMLDGYRLFAIGLVRDQELEPVIKVHYATERSLIDRGLVYFVHEKDSEGLCLDYFLTISEKGRRAMIDLSRRQSNEQRDKEYGAWCDDVAHGCNSGE